MMMIPAGSKQVVISTMRRAARTGGSLGYTRPKATPEDETSDGDGATDDADAERKAKREEAQRLAQLAAATGMVQCGVAGCAVPVARKGFAQRSEDEDVFEQVVLGPDTRFEIDPVIDTSIIAVSFGLAFFAELTISSGELEAQAPSEVEKLLPIDRWLVDDQEDTIGETAGLASDILLATTVTWGFFHPIMSWVRYDADEALALGVIYLESALTTLALTSLTKLAVRRPRPRAYVRRRLGEDPGETQSALSFPSGHTSITASITATAAYLSFAQDGIDSWIPWTITGVGAAMTVGVAVQRVMARAHFPTDVLAGALLGTGIGILVPHFHRVEDDAWSVDFVGDFFSSAGVGVNYTW